ncbi:MAG: SCO family protein, partial [Roseiflexaceae bacterium]
QLAPPDRAFDFALIDQNNQSQTLGGMRGNVVLIFFGFTNCPDVCPATLSDMQLLYNRLGEDAKDVRMVFITVDPERDTPDKLKRFVERFDARIMALSGDTAAL